MTPTPELVALVQRDRERAITMDALARLAARVRVSCDPSRFRRLVRVVRGAPAAC